MFSVNKREHSEILNELTSWQDQVKAVRLQDKLGKQNFYEDKKKVFEAFNKTITDVSEDVIKTIMITSKKNNLALET